MHFLVIDGPPKSKARPRFRRDGRVYASPEQIAAEQALGWRFKASFPEPMAGNLGVGCIFFRPNAQRIDVDNMLKHVMDSANKVIWADDSQVTAQVGIVELDAEHPRTVIVVGRHVSSLDRSEYAVKTRVCPTCGVTFQSKQKNPKFCSRSCSSLSKGESLMAEVPCAWCGVMFKRKNAGSRFCSDRCRMESLNNPKTPRVIPRCVHCGATLSKIGYRSWQTLTKTRIVPVARTRKPKDECSDSWGGSNAGQFPNDRCAHGGAWGVSRNFADFSSKMIDIARCRP